LILLDGKTFEPPSKHEGQVFTFAVALYCANSRLTVE
jgi:hypothetical protein